MKKNYLFLFFSFSVFVANAQNPPTAVAKVFSRGVAFTCIAAVKMVKLLSLSEGLSQTGTAISFRGMISQTTAFSARAIIITG